ncbi:MAG: magnesium transporter [Culturomica sp.]|jgi:magnesium transporter|nr:magnesium transporter [Culturomica sp.]
MKQFEVTEDFLRELEGYIEEDNKEKVKEIILPLHSVDIAEILADLDNSSAQYVFLLLDDDTAGEVLAHINDDERIGFLNSFPAETIAKRFIYNMDTDDAADVMGSMPEEQRDEIFSHMDDVEQAGDIVELLNYDEDTAGGLMAKELAVVNENWTVLTCLRELSRQAEHLDEIYNIYVVDDDDKLKGRLSMKKMIFSPTSTKINNLYYPDVIYVKTDESAEAVAHIMQKYDLVAIPVVDSIGRLVGRITIDDVVDVIREEAERDYQMMSGISQEIDTSDSIWAQTRARLPWLIIALFGGMISAYMISRYEAEIALFPVTAMFIPVITAMGGNVGIQSSAIVVQGLASNTLKANNSWRNIMKELGSSMLNATICSSVIFLLTLLFDLDSLAMPIAVTISLFIVIIFASIFGTAFPLMLNKLKIDPALATGPFITLTNDIIGLNIYLIVGRIILTAF